MPMVVVILLGRVGRVDLGLELLRAQRGVRCQSRKGFPTVSGDASCTELEVTLLDIRVRERFHVLEVSEEVHGCLVDVLGVTRHLLVEDAGPDKRV